MFPLLLVYYLSAGPRHRLGWHFAFFGMLLAAPGLNTFWLVPWMQSWWLRLPVSADGAALAHRTFQTFWDAACWGQSVDRALSATIFVAGTAGVVILNRTARRPAARLLGFGAGGLLLLTIAGMAWISIGRFGTSHLLLPALWFAVPAAAFGLGQLCHALTRFVGRWNGAIIVTASVISLFMMIGYPANGTGAERLIHARPLSIGLNADRLRIVETLRTVTTPDARILWEERLAPREASRWTALLPRFCQRAFIGGLGPDLCIEHGYAAMVGARLAQKNITEWSDAELEAYCRRYNVGWMVCWSAAANTRLKAWRGATPIAELTDNGTGTLFRLPASSFVLKGKAEWLHASSRHITLANVVPDDGHVVVSLHYQNGLQVSPPRVQLERQPDAHDPIPFVRLRVPAPVSHLTLTWQPP
jgi:hypothetical protein